MDRRGSSRRADGSERWSRLRADPASWLPISFIVTCLVLGGPLGTFSVPFLLLMLIGGALAVTAMARGWFDAFQSLPFLIRLAAVAWVALPFLQLIPLPPSWWQTLPGAGLRLQVLSAFGLQNHWLPLTTSPIETAYTAVVALAMFGLLLVALRVDERRFRTYLATAVGVLLLGATIGVIQFASGGSALELHAAADHTALVGFFTNKNHMGLALACLPPLLHVLAPRRTAVRRDAAVLAVSSIVLLCLIIATNSRAGMLLGMAAIAATALRRYPERRLLVASVLLILAIIGVLASLAIPSVAHLAERMGRSTDDVRGSFFEWSWPLARIYGPTGAGLGSFPDIFPPNEQLAWVKPTKLNAVHNDYLQSYIEGGVAAIVLLGWSLLTLAAAAIRTLVVRRHSASRAATDPVWAGSVIVVLFALHSVVDYPARRAAALVLLVLAIASVLRPLASRRAPSATR